MVSFTTSRDFERFRVDVNISIAFKEGGGAVTVPIAPDTQWDASTLTVGTQSTWEGTGTTTRTLSDQSVASHPITVVNEGGNNGVAFRAANYGGTTADYRLDLPPTGGTVFAATTLDTSAVTTPRWILGTDDAGDRGVYVELGASRIKLRSLVGDSTKYKAVNEYSEVTSDDFISFSDVTSVTDPEDVRIVGVRQYRDALNCFGGYRNTSTNILEGVIHEVLYYSTQLTDAQMVQVLDYLDTKWGFGLR